MMPRNDSRSEKPLLSADGPAAEFVNRNRCSIYFDFPNPFLVGHLLGIDLWIETSSSYKCELDGIASFATSRTIPIRGWHYRYSSRAARDVPSSHARSPTVGT